MILVKFGKVCALLGVIDNGKLVCSACGGIGGKE